MNFGRWSILFFLPYIIQCRYEDIHQPCVFNPLCTCSNAGPDLGSVNCINIPFMTIPAGVKRSAIYIMNLQNNNLRMLQDNSLNHTGLWKLQINHNFLTSLPIKALSGLEKTLSILDLTDNKIIRIPREALARLEKLQTLNLANNHISAIHTDDLFQFSRTLKYLDLSENYLSDIQDNAFRNMESLQNLNLAMNLLVSINDVMLNNRFYNLKSINLMENQLREIPFTALVQLKKLKSINLSKNLISSLRSDHEIEGTTALEELNLEYNLLEELSSNSFKNYQGINRIYLKGNPLHHVEDSAFFGTNATEINLSDCLLSDIQHDAFRGVENRIQVLDLSFNNITAFPKLPFTKLSKLNLAGNMIKDIEMTALTNIGLTLKYMDISGEKMGHFSESIMKHIPNIRYLNLKTRQTGKITKEDFLEISPTVEELHLIKNNIYIIEKGAFSTMSALKLLDLSYNSIRKIDPDSFQNIAHSLEKLIMYKSLSMDVFPENALKHLLKLEHLDLSSNHIKSIPQDSFAYLRYLRYLNLNHNDISEITGKHLNKKNNPEITSVKLAFNKIIALNAYSFSSLKMLKYIELQENLIKSIKRSTFVDLDSIISINLEGNNMEYIEDGAFQNLPCIQNINFAYNQLKQLNLDAFDQTGRLSTLKININHNKIPILTENFTSSHTSINIKIMTFNHNNISDIDIKYFDPVRHSVICLDFSANNMMNLTNSALNNMENLQILTIAQNKISDLGENAFIGLQRLQILNISHNNISFLHHNIFKDQKTLRIFDASHNKIKSLQTQVFQLTAVEQLDFSQNKLETFPSESLSHINKSLHYLDLSWNCLQSMNTSSDANLGNLMQLILSNNELHSLDDQTLENLPTLVSLDLSSNPVKKSNSVNNLVKGLPQSIESLNLANVSLTTFPNLNVSALISLNLSHNSIKKFPGETILSSANIQELDLSHNQLEDMENDVWSDWHQLQSLYIGSNPLKFLNNDSFKDMKNLQKLSMPNLHLTTLDPNIFTELPSLRQLEIDIFSSSTALNLSELLRENYGIKKIHLHLQDEIAKEIFKGKMPKSLSTVMLQGMQLKHLSEMALDGFTSKNLTLIIHRTSIRRIESKFFQHMHDIKNFTALLGNNKLQTVGRIPFHSQKEEANKRLKNLELFYNEIICDCSLHWIWDWLNEYMHECYEEQCYDIILSNLRETKCYNKKNSSFIDVFKTELQCFSSALALSPNCFFPVFTIMITVLFIAIS